MPVTKGDIPVYRNILIPYASHLVHSHRPTMKVATILLYSCAAVQVMTGTENAEKVATEAFSILTDSIEAEVLWHCTGHGHGNTALYYCRDRR